MVFVTVNGKQGGGPVIPGLVEMRDVNSNRELIDSSKNMLKKEATNIKLTPSRRRNNKGKKQKDSLQDANNYIQKRNPYCASRRDRKVSRNN